MTSRMDEEYNSMFEEIRLPQIKEEYEEVEIDEEKECTCLVTDPDDCPVHCEVEDMDE